MTVADDQQDVAVLRLSVSDFRCYPSLRLEVAARPVVLTGANGAGKTNILEALSFLAPGRGLRRCRLSEVARQGAASPAWAVAATVKKGEQAVEIGTGRIDASERRQVRIDGKPARSQASLGEWLSVLWLVPAMDRLFTDSAGGRRRFLDRLVLVLDQPHAARAGAYDHALRERARLLREGRRDKTWLEALETAIARHGVQMAEARRQLVDRLNQACAKGIGPFPAAELRLEGKIDAKLAEGGAEAAESCCATGWPPAATWTRWRSDRIAAICKCGIAARTCRPISARPANRRRCCCRSCWRRPGCNAICAACRRSCCSTRWPPISTARGGWPCGMSWRRSVCKAG